MTLKENISMFVPLIIACINTVLFQLKKSEKNKFKQTFYFGSSFNGFVSVNVVASSRYRLSFSFISGIHYSFTLSIS